MKLSTLILVLVTSASIVCNAQEDTYLHTRYTIERISASSTDIYGGPIRTVGPNLPPGTIGDVYLSENFNVSAFQLYENNQLVEGYFSKLDLKNNEFDILTKSGVKALKGNLVKSFIYDDSVTNIRHSFVNAKEWKTNEGVTLLGFFEVISHGDMVLADYTELEFIKANYNAAKNVGSKDNKYVKKTKHYYVVNKIATSLPKKKTIFEIFGERSEELQKYSEDNHLNLKSTLDLKRLFDYYNHPTAKGPN